MRVVCISAECEPWAKTGGLGDVVDALARAVGARGRTYQQGDAGIPHIVQSQVWVGTGGVMGVGDGMPASYVEPPVDVFLPRYRGIEIPAEATSRPLAVPDPLAASGTTDVTLVEFEARGYRVRLVDHPPAFDRDNYYGDENGDYTDNGWRFGLLCRAALEALLVDDRPVDVLHLHDWQAMPAVLLRDCAYEAYPLISRAAVMATIHNLAYQGWLTREQAAGLAFPDELKRAMKPHAEGLLLLREGIERAELVNTVSPSYAQEALTPAFGMGLDPVLAGLGHRFGGILNGLDMVVWDPETDSELPAPYSRGDMSGKAACRRALLSELGFDPDDEGPVLGMIGRLDPQKGFDLVAGAAPELVEAGARIVVLGTGDPKLVRGLLDYRRSTTSVRRGHRRLRPRPGQADLRRFGSVSDAVPLRAQRAGPDDRPPVRDASGGAQDGRPGRHGRRRQRMADRRHGLPVRYALAQVPRQCLPAGDGRVPAGRR